jgi:hypothetical protein
MKHATIVRPGTDGVPGLALGAVGQSASFTAFLDTFMFVTEAAGDSR